MQSWVQMRRGSPCFFDVHAVLLLLIARAFGGLLPDIDATTAKIHFLPHILRTRVKGAGDYFVFILGFSGVTLLLFQLYA